ncbi:MAG: DMT family transporter [Pseudomonadota bacterium]
MHASADRSRVLGTYLLVLFCWSTSWYAMKLQVGTATPALSIALRFLLAAPLMFGWVAWRRGPMRYDLRTHALFAVMGSFMFSINFLFAYHAAMFLTSALVSVVFSLAAMVNLLLGALFLGQRVTWRAAAGALAGAAGLVLLLWGDVAAKGLGHAPWFGLLLALGMTLSFCFGNMASAVLQRRGVPVASATAWAMPWGAICSLVFAFGSTQPLVFDVAPRYLGSLAFLVIFGTVLGFHAYLTLLGRIGPARASYATVLAPIGALLVSSVFEGYQWTTLSFVGIACTLAGNVLILGASRRKAAVATAAGTAGPSATALSGATRP